MTKIGACLAAAAAIVGLASCGDGSGGGGSAECNAICSNACIENLLPANSFDDCVRACNMDSGILENCLSETVSVLNCLEAIDCGNTGSIECLDEAEAFSNCID